MRTTYWWWLSHLVVHRSNSSTNLLSFSYGIFHTPHVAPGAKLSGAGATLIFGGEVIYIWHANEMLVVAVSGIACVCRGSGLNRVAHVSEHVCGEAVFCTNVVHSTMIFAITIVRHVWVRHDVRRHERFFYGVLRHWHAWWLSWNEERSYPFHTTYMLLHPLHSRYESSFWCCGSAVCHVREIRAEVREVSGDGGNGAWPQELEGYKSSMLLWSCQTLYCHDPFCHIDVLQDLPSWVRFTNMILVMRRITYTDHAPLPRMLKHIQIKILIKVPLRLTLSHVVTRNIGWSWSQVLVVENRLSTLFPRVVHQQ